VWKTLGQGELMIGHTEDPVSREGHRKNRGFSTTVEKVTRPGLIQLA
jgi:hypothetical protein